MNTSPAGCDMWQHCEFVAVCWPLFTAWVLFSYHSPIPSLPPSLSEIPHDLVFYCCESTGSINSHQIKPALTDSGLPDHHSALPAQPLIHPSMNPYNHLDPFTHISMYQSTEHIRIPTCMHPSIHPSIPLLIHSFRHASIHNSIHQLFHFSINLSYP